MATTTSMRFRVVSPQLEVNHDDVVNNDDDMPPPAVEAQELSVEGNGRSSWVSRWSVLASHPCAALTEWPPAAEPACGPFSCQYDWIAGSLNPTEEVARQIPPLLAEIVQSEGQKRTQALQRLYRWTDKERASYRVPLICTTQFDVLQALETCLWPASYGGTGAATTTAADRKWAWWMVTNLAIPVENKAALLWGEPQRILLPALLAHLSLEQVEEVVDHRHHHLHDDGRSSSSKTNRQHTSSAKTFSPEVHWAAACLYNLSFLDDFKINLLAYVPPRYSDLGGSASFGGPSPDPDYRYHPPLQNPRSLLRTAETLLQEFTPYYLALQQQQQQQQQERVASTRHDHRRPAPPPAPKSVEGEAIRWIMGTLRNLVMETENAVTVGTETLIPTYAAQYILAALAHEPPDPPGPEKKEVVGAPTSGAPLCHWTRHSLEESSLMILVHLAKHDACVPFLQGNDLIEQALQALQGRGGIHALRARTVRQKLHEKGPPTASSSSILDFLDDRTPDDDDDDAAAVHPAQYAHADPDDDTTQDEELGEKMAEF